MQDAGASQRLAVGPRCVAVEGRQHKRSVGHKCIKQAAVERLRLVGQRGVAQLYALNPFEIGMLGSIGAHSLCKLADAVHIIKVQQINLQGAEQQVKVAVDEAGHEGAAAAVDHLRLGRVMVDCAAVVAHVEDAVAAHGHSLRRRLLHIGGVNCGIEKNDVGGRTKHRWHGNTHELTSFLDEY